MRVVIPKEVFPGENRTALVPASVLALKKAGFEVAVERACGATSHFSDNEYKKAGAEIAAAASALYASADIVLKVRPPELEEIKKMNEGAVLICLMDAFFQTDTIKQLTAQKISGFGLEFVPRIARAQSMDVLSSMAAIAGYRAVIEAANLLPKYFPMLMTAAGTITPAKVLVIGAGVAGLTAIATAKRLGAIVKAYDTRKAVKEQVESIGGTFVDFQLAPDEAENKGGYARTQSDAFYEMQRQQMQDQVSAADVVISTAAVPGKKAPVLITDEMLQTMRPGSVLIDLAAERGGNVEGTVFGKVVKKKGVKIVGYTDYPSRSCIHASQLFSRNITAFLLNMAKDRQLVINLEDEIVKSTLLTHNGRVIHEALKSLPEKERV